MRESARVIGKKRVAAIAVGCALALGVSGCTDSTDGTPKPASSDSASTPNASGYSVQNALATLPQGKKDDGPVMIATADLDAATEQSGLTRPTSLDDKNAVIGWINPLTGAPGAGNDPAPIFVPMAQGFRTEYLFASDMLSFQEELGWSVLDAATFAERQTLPYLFTVVSGKFDKSTFPKDLPEVAKGVVTAGEGEDLHQDIGNRTAARPLGAPLRMAIKDSYLAAAPSTDEVSAWLDGSAKTFAKDADLSAVAKALDDAGAISAMLTSGAIRSIDDQKLSPSQKKELADVLPSSSFDTVGIGWAIKDGESVITVAFKFKDDKAAKDAVPVFEKMFADGSSITGTYKLSDLYSFKDAKSDGSVAIVTLSPGEDGGPGTIYKAMAQYDLPFMYK